MQMHAEKKFDDSLSGTTSISVLLRGRTMYVSNVGDSRAILVSMKVRVSWDLLVWARCTFVFA